MNVKITDNAYVHVHGTKYYRITSIVITGGATPVYAYCFNYGGYKSSRAGINGHKPKDTGTSSITVFASERQMQRKFDGEHTKRLGRNYLLQTPSGDYYPEDIDAEDVRTLLRNGPGLITGHIDEIMSLLVGSERSEVPWHEEVCEAPAAVIKPAPPEPIRGIEWGSW